VKRGRGRGFSDRNPEKKKKTRRSKKGGGEGSFFHSMRESTVTWGWGTKRSRWPPNRGGGGGGGCCDTWEGKRNRRKKKKRETEKRGGRRKNGLDGHLIAGKGKERGAAFGTEPKRAAEQRKGKKEGEKSPKQGFSSNQLLSPKGRGERDRGEGKGKGGEGARRGFNIEAFTYLTSLKGGRRISSPPSF